MAKTITIKREQTEESKKAPTDIKKKKQIKKTSVQKRGVPPSVFARTRSDLLSKFVHGNMKRILPSAQLSVKGAQVFGSLLDQVMQDLVRRTLTTHVATGRVTLTPEDAFIANRTFLPHLLHPLVTLRGCRTIAKRHGHEKELDALHEAHTSMDSREKCFIEES